MTFITRFGGFFISRSPMKTANKPYTPPSSSYQGTELKPHPGLPASRFHAFTLPSRMGDWLHYPDGRVEPFPPK